MNEVVLQTVFEVLNKINVNNHTEKKNGLTYLSWAWAWAEVKNSYPDANYTIYQNEELGGMPYFTDGKTCMVKTGVTIGGIEHIEFLPVMDYKNKSIKVADVTSYDINKAIQRSLTKACARHGLGLYIYAGEDLPEDAIAIENPKKDKFMTNEHINTVKKYCAEFKTNTDKICEKYKIKDLSDMTYEQFTDCCNNFESLLENKKADNK